MTESSRSGPVRILTVNGSLQAASGNGRVLQLAAELAPVGCVVTAAISIGELPHFNPDLDVAPAPEVIVTWRAQLAAADGVLIAAPEYAHSLPGALKDALDWIVGSGELYGKPVALLNAAGIEVRGKLGREALQQTLNAQGATIVASATAVTGSEVVAVTMALDALVAAVSG